MSGRIRALPPGDAPANCPIADQIRVVAEKAIASGAVVFLGIWESPNAFDRQAVPAAEAVEDGLIRRMFRERPEDEID